MYNNEIKEEFSSAALNGIHISKFLNKMYFNNLESDEFTALQSSMLFQIVNSNLTFI